MPGFEVQGHRGARGLRPENTLPSFEAALDAGVGSIETDIHLTRDGAPVLHHDAHLSDRICRSRSPQTLPSPSEHPRVSSLKAEQLQRYSADLNPDPEAFPGQKPEVSAVAELYARANGMHPFSIPLLSDLFAFVQAYEGMMGEQAGKTAEQRAGARRVWFDLELKRVPYSPEVIGDGFDGLSPALLERKVYEIIQSAGVAGRTRVRSFDHRSVLAFRLVAPAVATAVLLQEAVPVAPEELLRAARADLYCPDFRFLDERVVRRVQAAGFRVAPYTVNDPADWRRLLHWGVDGITTDYPDRLAAFLSSSGFRHRQVEAAEMMP
jgi:glycerophosphoryl diester phosphodiesterase